MRWPRVRVTERGLMAAVAGVALVALVAWNATLPGGSGITDRRVVVPVASAVAAAYGVGAMRRPVTFLVPLIAAWIVTPQVDHPAPDVVNSSAAACCLAWIIGAPAGYVTRASARPAGSGPVAPDPPEPKSADRLSRD